MNTVKQTLSGWGLFPKTSSYVYRPEKVKNFEHIEVPCIPRGYGRCYGDAAQLTDGSVVLTGRLDRFLSFDDEKGVLRGEAGISFNDLLKTVVPRGWFPPVTPGTKWVSLGGCIAADVHGKNHHVDGSFGEHVLGLELIVPGGGKVRCSPSQDEELFWATVGGMGLTGIILEVTLQLLKVPSAYISVTNHAAANLDDLFDKLSNPSLDDKYSVAWVDCTAVGTNFGRGIIMNGHHAAVEELPKGLHPFRVKEKHTWPMPFSFSSVLLSRRTIDKFNRLYFTYYGNKKEPYVVDYDTYFYPLDVIDSWNRVYGKKGFVQYQFVTPTDRSRKVCKRVLEMLAQANYHPYLAVLKRFGPQGQGYLSFPKEGFTLAVDIPIRDEKLFPLLDKLDTVILENDGRVYLAKDARMSASSLPSMYPQLDAWKQIRRRIDPQGKMTSDLSKRLQL